MLRRWRSAWPKRSKRYDPTWPQGAQTQPFPGVHKPAGARPLRFPARPRRGKFVEPAWPQGSPATPNPALYDQAGVRPRFAPKLRRGRFHEPVWPQGSTATPPPAVHHAVGPRPLRFPPLPRRGRSFEPPWPQIPGANPPPALTGHGYRPRTAVTRRGTYIPVPLAPASTWPPRNVCGRRTPARPARRGAYFPVAPVAPRGSAPAYQRSRRPVPLLARHPGRHAAAPPIWAPPAPPRIIAVSGARAVARWATREGAATWAARLVQRWNGREGGSR